MHSSTTRSRKFERQIESGLELLDACFDDIAYARVLLKTDGSKDVDWSDEEGVSLLHTLAYYDKVGAVKLLLDHEANPNSRNNKKETPLHWCAAANAINAAKIIIGHGKCQLNAKDNSQSTPLHVACAFENLEMVSILLTAGASVSEKDKDDETAIEIVSRGTTPVSFAIAVALVRIYENNGESLPVSVKAKYDRPAQDGEEEKEVETEKKKKDFPPSVSPADDRDDGDEDSNNNGEGAEILQIETDGISETTPGMALRSVSSPTIATNIVKRDVELAYVDKKNKNVGGRTANEHSSQSKSGFQQYQQPKAVRKITQEKFASYDMGESSKSGTSVRKELAPLANAFNSNSSKSESKFAKSLKSRGLSLINPTKRSAAGKSDGNEGECETSTEEDIMDTAELVLLVNRSNNEDPTAADNNEEETEGVGGGTIAETVFVPADTVPLLPGCSAGTPSGNSVSKYLDVIIAVEHCCDCENHNNQSLRHDSKKYVAMANSVLYTLIKTVVDSRYAVRVFAFRLMPTSKARLGALEVTMSVNINRPMSNREIEELERQEEEAVALATLLAATAKTPGSGSGGRSVPGTPVPPHGAKGGNRSTMRHSVTTTGTAVGRPPVLKKHGAAGGGHLGQAHAHHRAGSMGANKQRGGHSHGQHWEGSVDPAVGISAFAEAQKRKNDPSRNNAKWATHQLFSKLEAKSWPNMSQLKDAANAFLKATILESVTSSFIPDKHEETVTETAAIVAATEAEEGDHHCMKHWPEAHNHYHGYKYDSFNELQQEQIGRQYQEWLDRIKKPDVIVRDPLDLNWPSWLTDEQRENAEKLEQQQREEEEAKLVAAATAANGGVPVTTTIVHPKSPYLDYRLAQKLSRLDFEKIVLNHFLVYDMSTRAPLSADLIKNRTFTVG